MRFLITIPLLLATFGARPLHAQRLEPMTEPVHVAIESTAIVLDDERVRGLGLHAILLSLGDRGLGPRHGHHTVRVNSRIGDLEVSAWLSLVRNNRAVRQESTQKIVTLSGSSARISVGHSLVAGYGQLASAGPELWVQPVVLDDGRVHLRLWTAVGEVRTGPHGSVWQEVPVEATTEIVVPSGIPVLVASNELLEERSETRLLKRNSATLSTQSWIVVTARLVMDPVAAFEMP